MHNLKCVVPALHFIEYVTYTNLYSSSSMMLILLHRVYHLLNKAEKGVALKKHESLRKESASNGAEGRGAWFYSRERGVVRELALIPVPCCDTPNY